MKYRAANLVATLLALTGAAFAQNAADHQAVYDAYNCKVPGKTPCTRDADCIDRRGKTGGIVKFKQGTTKRICGWAYCERRKGVCRYGPFNPQCTEVYTECSDQNIANRMINKNHEKCNTGKVPSNIKSVGVCSGLGINQCNYAWCPNDIKPSLPPTLNGNPAAAPTPKPAASNIPDPLYDNYSCPAAKKCKSKADCVDNKNGVTGARTFCGETFCDKKGVCRVAMWNSTCPEFVECANTHSLCYNGPSSVDYIGSCSGYDNNECRYAWCLNSPATTTTTTSTTLPPPPVDIRVPSGITVTLASNGDLKREGSSLYKAVATFPTGTEDITTKATWTSSDPAMADFDFPGLLEAKALSGNFNIKATFNGVSSTNLPAVISPTSGPPTCGTKKLKMKVLVIYQSEALDQQRGPEATVPAIQRALGYIGIPYDMVRQSMLGTITWRDTLCTGNYQAVVVSDGGLRWQPGSFLDKKGYHLDAYQVDFGVRVVNWFTWPSTAFGWSSTPAAYGTGDDILCNLTPEGQGIFNYVNPSYKIKLALVWNQVAKHMASSPGSVPLLMDANGNAHMVLYKEGGREMITMTFGSNQFTRHNIVLGYGVLNWATKGQFIGFRRVYIRADMDDYFIDDDIFAPSVPCGTPTDQTGIKWRMAKEDLEAVIAWQKGIKAGPEMYKEIVLDMVFNGIGSNGIRFNPDTLTPLTLKRDVESLFRWVSHGWDHLNEDKTSYRVGWEEVYHNKIVAEGRDFNFTHFTRDAMVTGQVSGLKNPNFLTAARDLGIRYLVADTSRAGENPGDNKGLYNWFVPEIFMIPRRPNNLFYNVALPSEWVHEYNCIFKAFWGKDLTVDEIINFEAEQLVGYMLHGEKYPWMFHQANMRAYSKPGVGTKFLLEELLDNIFAKYSAIYNIPITSPAMDELGRDIISHNEIETAKVQGVLAVGIGAKILATSDTRTPLTGFDGEGNRLYGGQNQCYVRVKANSAPKFVPSKL